MKLPINSRTPKLPNSQTPKLLNSRTQLILALDVETFAQAQHFINLLYPQIRIFKVGLQLFTASGPEVIEFIRKKGAEVFLDLKFHDIPNTVANAVVQAARLKVKMLTLHISGGAQMLRAAVDASREEAARIKQRPLLLIGVTVLTSQETQGGEVLRLAKSGLACGLDGIVCSAREAKSLRDKIKKDFIIVTPGIRPRQAGPDDHKRVVTAREAIAAGSDFLVIGRPILEARDPFFAVKTLLVE